MILKRNILFCVYTSWRNYCVEAQARFLKKLIYKGERNSFKRKSLPKSISMNEYARNMLYTPAKKRMAVLNKVFMEHICDLTSAGDFSEQLVERGIQIVQTKVSPNLHILFVYWVHTKPIIEEEVRNLLSKVASNLRFELSTLKVMGNVPEIRFVRHENAFQTEVLNKIFEDLSLARETEKLSNEKEELNDTHKEKFEDYTDNAHYELQLDRVLSKMNHDVYGLNYQRISQNIMKEKLRKRQPVQREGIPEIASAESAELRCDKKLLEKVIFKKSNELRKCRKLNRKLMNVVASEDEQHSNYDDFETEEYDNMLMIEEMMEKDSCEDNSDNKAE